jgi:hypothetical protein
LFGPGKVSTDDENDGATSGDKVETSVSIVAALGGKVTINEKDISQPAPVGFNFFGEQVEIAAPPAVPSNPLTIIFTLDASIIPGGQNQNTVQVFRDGSQVPNCTGTPGTANPNPCVSSRVLLTGTAAGDIQLTVLTTAASAWNFGVPNGTPIPTATPGGVPGDVNCDGEANTLDAQLILQYLVGLVQALPCPQNADVSGNGDIDATDALLILQKDAGIIDDFPD